MNDYLQYIYSLSFLLCALSSTAQPISSTDSLATDKVVTDSLAIDSSELAFDVLPSLFQHFSQDSILELTIESDIKHLIKKKYGENYQAAVLAYERGGEAIRDSVKIRPRGNSRRKICVLPPIKIKYNKHILAAKELHPNYKTLKLVTHCKVSDLNQKLLLKEYLIYRMYSLVSPNHFRVQLVKINYIDTGRKRKKTSRYGFLIENHDEMAARLNGILYEKKNVGPRALHIQDYNTLTLFQYMIGNTDWQIKFHHNIKMVRPSEGKRLIAVPYDFDYCGLVDAYYAVPNEQLSLTNVKVRLFLGVCWDMEKYEPSIALFEKRKEEFKEIIQSFTLLPKRDRENMMDYLESFYKVVKRRKYLEEELRWRCR